MKKKILFSVALGVSLFMLFVVQAGATPDLQGDTEGRDSKSQESGGIAPVAVSENGKYLVTAAGDPFFWMGDTAWDLTHRLTKEEIEIYLDDRKDKGFNVIFFRLPFKDLEGEPQRDNRYGQVPFVDKDITQPNEAYFELVDFTLDEMEKRGMVAGILPMWGFIVVGRFGHNIDEDNIQVYANWLSERYQDRKNIIWVSGGDTGEDKRWEVLGTELKNADPEKLVTFHPGRRGVSSYHLYGDAEWLDFHMTQTGHSPDLETTYLTVNEVYNESSKPILNGEPAYEDMWGEGRDRISAHQVRKAAYWSLLAGGFGHVYGHMEIFQFARAMAGQPDTWGANNPWTEALDDPGAKQTAALSTLLQSVPWHRFQPKQSLIASENPTGPAHIRASAMDDGSTAWIYFPEKQAATINLAQLEGDFDVRWFDPATGEIQEAGTVEAGSSKQFTSPFAEDALLMLVPPEGGWFMNSDLIKMAVLAVGALLVLILLYFLYRQVKAGLGG